MTTRKLLKIHRWWASHYGTMVAFIYLVLLLTPTPPSLSAVVTTFALFTAASLGIGSFGHLLNDLADVSQDLRSGAHNLVASKTAGGRIALFTAALLVGLLPWCFLPVTPAIAGLVAAEYALFMIYSLPPLRLKNRGFLGPATDAMYGYVIPNAVAVLLFSRLGHTIVPFWMMVVLVIWCFLFGLDRIIHHQLLDAAHDESAGVQTFVVRKGWGDAFRVLHMWGVPALAVASIALLGVWASTTLLVPAGFVLYAVLTLVSWSHRGLWNTCRLGNLPSIDRYHLVAERLIATFVWRWLALLALVALVIARPRYLPLVPLHVALFPAGVLWTIRHGIPEACRLALRHP